MRENTFDYILEVMNLQKLKFISFQAINKGPI